MARMSIDDGLGRDPRLDDLADLCGWTRRETAGCLQLDIWPLCYDRVTPNITPREINIAANRGTPSPVKHQGGFAAALIKSGLARRSTPNDTSFVWSRDGHADVAIPWRDTEWRGRVYVRGAAERISYLLKQRESGRIGGSKNKDHGDKNKDPQEDTDKAPSTDPSRDAQGSGNPSATPSAPVPDPTSGTSTPSPPMKKSSPRVSHSQPAIDAFHEYYKRTHKGATPSWTSNSGRNRKSMNSLVDDHGVAEVIRRIGILEASPPTWPLAPWDMPTFSTHFDKIAIERRDPDDGRYGRGTIASDEDRDAGYEQLRRESPQMTGDA